MELWAPPSAALPTVLFAALRVPSSGLCAVRLCVFARNKIIGSCNTHSNLRDSTAHKVDRAAGRLGDRGESD